MLWSILDRSTWDNIVQSKEIFYFVESDNFFHTYYVKYIIQPNIILIYNGIYYKTIKD